MSIKYKQKEKRSRKQCWSETLSKLRYYWQHLNILLYCLLLPKWLSITYYCTRIFSYLRKAYTIMQISMWVTLFIFSYIVTNVSGVRIRKLEVPEMAQAGHEVHLLCDYDLERARLYQVIKLLEYIIWIIQLTSQFVRISFAHQWNFIFWTG